MYSSRNASQTICSFSCIASVTISSPLASGVGVVGVSSSPLLAVCWSLFSMSTSSALSSRFLFRERRIDIWRTFTPLGVFDYAQQYCETSSWTFVTGWWSLVRRDLVDKAEFESSPLSEQRKQQPWDDTDHDDSHTIHTNHTTRLITIQGDNQQKGAVTSTIFPFLILKAFDDVPGSSLNLYDARHTFTSPKSPQALCTSASSTLHPTSRQRYRPSKKQICCWCR